MSVVDPTLVAHIATLANLPAARPQDAFFVSSLGAMIDLISTAGSMDTANVEETSQVTGLENVFREDVIDTNRMFTQEEALANAKNRHKGYFVVPSVFE